MTSRLVITGFVVLLGVLTWSPSVDARPFVQQGSVDASVTMGGYFFLGDESTLKDTFSYRAAAGYNYSPRFGAELAFDWSPQEVNAASVYQLHIDVLYHLWSHDWVVPFVGAGPSVTVVAPAEGENDSDPGANVVVGAKFYPWEQVGLRVDARYIARFGTQADESMDHDLLVAAGLIGTFGGEARLAEMQLDTDGDGFVDDIDRCPQVPGVESAGGCPDGDGDTVADAEDKCPEEPGVPALAGCPDTDFDTVVDAEDKCPKIPGPVEQGGCPDTDTDGLVDPDDRCPMIAGEVAYKGCPPPPPADVIERFTGVMVGITFEQDSDVIRASSNAVLDEAFQVLTKYTHLRLLIEGHTSSEGTPEHNVSLSKRRSKAVKKYLVDKGVSEGRIETEGFGSQYPVATNENKKGRSQNRRIEFKILRQ